MTDHIKNHKRIIIFSIILLLIVIILEIIGFALELEKPTPYNIAMSVFLLIWVVAYPSAFYTCYRLISDDNAKGRFLDGLIHATYGGISGGVFFIPLLLSPFLLVDYIYFFKQDYRNAKFLD